MRDLKIHKMILIILFQLTISPPNPQTLYDENSKIVSLKASNLRQFLNNTDNVRVVEFYASWCGACVRFSKIYEKLASDIENWNIYTAAINCADNDNADICSEYFVYSYPTLKLFYCKQNEQLMKHEDMKTISKDLSANEMRKALANFILENNECAPATHQSYKFDPKFWNDFKELLTPYKYLIVVIGTMDDKGIVNSLSLDFMNCNRFFIQFIDLNQTEYVSLFGGSLKSKRIIAVNHDVEIKVITEGDFDDYNEIRKNLFNDLNDECPNLSLFKSKFGTNTLESSEKTKKENYTVLSEVYMDDILSGISYTLREEITRAPINLVEFNAIQDWLNALYDCVPLEKEQKEFILNLKQWSIAQGDKLTNVEWKHYLESQQALNVFPAEMNWKACKGSTQYYRGFPCSLWQTFHIMTVNCLKPGSTFGVDSMKVLSTARGYILNFFGCASCREHFRELTKRIAQLVFTNEQAILFLWNGHNLVNARLRLDDSADPTAPKIQFPSVELCPDCRKIDGLDKSNIFTSTPGYDVAPIKWNRNEVLAFLLGHYGLDNIRRSSSYTFMSRSDDKYDASVEYAKAIAN